MHNRRCSIPALWVRFREKILDSRLAVIVLLILTSATANAQSDPWSSMTNKLAPIFTGPVARGFTLVGCVIGGLQLIFGEGGGKRMMGGLLFGGALALGAAQLVAALFG